MKFIKTVDGDYVRVDKIVAFDIEQSKASDKLWNVYAYFGIHRAALKQLSSKTEAQAWLDDFVAKLNAEQEK
ncbi:MAG: hypothetical protein IKG61_01340 [Selenomonadaceae bacterium]|nr:hypothetical protein [Selenomonadaceae bacterium]MBR3050080.1 hypothetical protein [Selenomonadaceae bacterium]